MNWPWTRGRSREQSLSDHFDGVLRGREARDVETAASTDPDAKRRLVDYARLREAFRAAEPARDDRSDAEYVAGVTRRIAETPATQTVVRPLRRWVAAPAAGLALVATVLVIWRVMAPVEDLQAPASSERLRESMDASTGVVDERLSAAPLAEARRGSREEVGLGKRTSAAPADLGHALDLSDMAAASRPAVEFDLALERATDAALTPAGGGLASAAATTTTDPEAKRVARFRSTSIAAHGLGAVKLLPYTLRIVEAGRAARAIGLEAGAEMAFTRDGVQHTVSVRREEDGRWTVSSAYHDTGSLVATERRSRLFRLSSDGERDAAPGAPFARFRIAQPLVGSNRLYAEVVATPVAVSQPDSGPKEGRKDAP